MFPKRQPYRLQVQHLEAQIADLRMENTERAGYIRELRDRNRYINRKLEESRRQYRYAYNDYCSMWGAHRNLRDKITYMEHLSRTKDRQLDERSEQYRVLWNSYQQLQYSREQPRAQARQQHSDVHE